MYGFEALIINQWKDYGPICMYQFFFTFPVKDKCNSLYFEETAFCQMSLCNPICHTMDCVWLSASSVASQTSPGLALPNVGLLTCRSRSMHGSLKPACSVSPVMDV